MSTPENPPAFPVAYEHNEATAEYHGMTLRDYFAAKAMAALIRNYSQPEDFKSFSQQSMEKGIPIPTLFARMAYENADAMLRARNRAGEEGRS